MQLTFENESNFDRTFILKANCNTNTNQFLDVERNKKSCLEKQSHLNAQRRILFGHTWLEMDTLHSATEHFALPVRLTFMFILHRVCVRVCVCAFFIEIFLRITKLHYSIAFPIFTMTVMHAANVWTENHNIIYKRREMEWNGKQQKKTK